MRLLELTAPGASVQEQQERVDERQLMSRGRQLLSAKFRSVGLKGTDVEDLTQECLVELFTHFHRFDPSKGNLDAWISGFARNALRTHWRRETVRRAMETTYDQVSEAGLASTEQAHELDAVTYALDELPMIDRELLYMRFALGMSFDDIARNADISCVNARKRVSRAVERLRRDPIIREALGF